MNFYSLLPEQPYHRTSIEMGAVISALKKFPVSQAVKIACYVIFRNESGNGKSGINNNYIGAQADSGRWPNHLDRYITGWTRKKESMTGKSRLFLTFAGVEGSLAFLIDRIQDRGLYVSGTCNKIAHGYIADADDWCRYYWKSWVTGDEDADIPASELKGLMSMYRQGEGCFKNQNNHQSPYRSR